MKTIAILQTILIFLVIQNAQAVVLPYEGLAHSELTHHLKNSKSFKARLCENFEKSIQLKLQIEALLDDASPAKVKLVLQNQWLTRKEAQLIFEISNEVSYKKIQNAAEKHEKSCLDSEYLLLGISLDQNGLQETFKELKSSSLQPDAAVLKISTLYLPETTSLNQLNKEALPTWANEKLLSGDCTQPQVNQNYSLYVGAKENYELDFGSRCLEDLAEVTTDDKNWYQNPWVWGGVAAAGVLLFGSQQFTLEY